MRYKKVTFAGNEHSPEKKKIVKQVKEMEGNTFITVGYKQI